MTNINLLEKAESYLNRLCFKIPDRRVGSKGNQMSSEFIAQVLSSFDFQIEYPEFSCMDWTHGDVHLDAGGEPFDAYIGPYSLGCDLNLPFMVASNLDELGEVEAANKILLLNGDITKEQLMPKKFPFYNPARHKKIINLLEKKRPAAIIASTTRNPELAGGMYPFPLIEDGDFDIPSVYMKEEECNRLLRKTKRAISLKMTAERIPSKGYNVIARKGGDLGRKVVICAHLDAKDGTPGALDNGTGVVVLLLLAELLKDYSGRLGVEIVALNGEDHYSAQGQIEYINGIGDRFNDILLAINLDAPGYRQDITAFSLYECPEKIADTIREVLSSRPDVVEGEQWYQGDHSIFIQNQVPAMAITSDKFMWLSTHITHTSKDRPELVDYDKLVDIGLALREFVLELNLNLD